MRSNASLLGCSAMRTFSMKLVCVNTSRLAFLASSFASASYGSLLLGFFPA